MWCKIVVDNAIVDLWNKNVCITSGISKNPSCYLPHKLTFLLYLLMVTFLDFIFSNDVDVV